jgi:nucleotide-binding universal stress UspA family protein
MFRTILWATDGSDVAAQAFPYALELAGAAGAKLVIAHAREIFVGRAGGYPVLADEDELSELIEAQVEKAGACGVDVSSVVRTCTAGHSASMIAEIAREVGADLIVVGTHGHGRVGGLLLGSVTQGLLLAHVCPVLATPPGSSAGADAVELEASAAT